MGDSSTLRLKTSQLAARQWGHVTRQQLLGLGMTGAMLGAWVRDGKLVRVHQGVYALGYRRVEPVALARAAVLACGPTAVLSHESAAALWDLRRWPKRHEVTISGDRRPREITVHRSRTLTRRHTTTQLGVPTTTAARTLSDLKPRLTARQFTRLVNRARLDHHLSTEQATRMLQRAGNPTRSGLEDDFLAFIHRYKLPVPITDTPLNGFEVDVLFPVHRLIVELDDYGTHGDPVTFETDRERDTVQLDHGHLTIRMTRDRLNRQEAQRLRRILDGRAG